MKRQHNFLIGIEGGGTKSTAIITDSGGKILARSNGMATNPNTVGFEISAKVCFQLISECCKKANCVLKEISSVVIGTAGAGDKTNQSKLKKILHNYCAKKNTHPKIIITSDAHIALAGALGNESGIIMIAGTGSILLGRNHDLRTTIHEPQIFRIGGWGKILGDDGSGFAIARDAVKDVVSSFDKTNETSALTKSALKYFNAKSVPELPSKIANGKKELSSFAPIVIELAKKKDFRSLFVVEFHCNALLQQVHLMCNNFFCSEKLSFVLLGGLLENENFYSHMLREKIKEYFPHLEIIKPKFSPVYGAILLAMKTK
jgi:N-acetylglucosamine kinase-like BadF-type ATPase